MKRLFYLWLIVIAITIVGCENKNEVSSTDLLFEEPCLLWGADVTAATSWMTDHEFTLIEYDTLTATIKYAARRKEQYTSLNVYKNNYNSAFIPFDTTKVATNIIQDYLAKQYTYYKTTNGTNIYITSDKQTLVYAVTVYGESGDFIWHAVTFCPNK